MLVVKYASIGSRQPDKIQVVFFATTLDASGGCSVFVRWWVRKLRLQAAEARDSALFHQQGRSVTVRFRAAQQQARYHPVRSFMRTTKILQTLDAQPRQPRQRHSHRAAPSIVRRPRGRRSRRPPSEVTWPGGAQASQITQNLRRNSTEHRPASAHVFCRGPGIPYHSWEMAVWAVESSGHKSLACARARAHAIIFVIYTVFSTKQVELSPCACAQRKHSTATRTVPAGRDSIQKMPRRRECLSYARLYLSTTSFTMPIPFVMMPR